MPVLSYRTVGLRNAFSSVPATVIVMQNKPLNPKYFSIANSLHPPPTRAAAQCLLWGSSSLHPSTPCSHLVFQGVFFFRQDCTEHPSLALTLESVSTSRARVPSCLGLHGKLWHTHTHPFLESDPALPSPPVFYTEIPTLHPLHPHFCRRQCYTLVGGAGIRCSWWENCIWNDSSCSHYTSAGDLVICRLESTFRPLSAFSSQTHRSS